MAYPTQSVIKMLFELLSPSQDCELLNKGIHYYGQGEQNLINIFMEELILIRKFHSRDSSLTCINYR